MKPRLIIAKRGLQPTGQSLMTGDASNRRSVIAGVWLSTVVCLGAMTGCRGRAYDDLYRAKMANEIRVLEDQLYDADYQNRVLRDQLTRAEETNASLKETESGSARSPRRPSRGGGGGAPRPSGSEDHTKTRNGPLDDEVLNLDQPMLGDPPGRTLPSDSADGPRLSTPPPAANPADSLDAAAPSDAKPDAGDGPKPLADPPSGGLGMPSATIPTPIPDSSNSDSFELPAPAVPSSPPEMVPPAPGQLMDDQIIPGEKRPPSADQDSQDKIEIPEGSRTMQFEISPDPTPAIPDHLELHDGLSGGHQFDEDSDIDGLFLVVMVVDKEGEPVSLDQFDVDADLTVVVTDPEDESDDAEVGRWEFSSEEVRNFIRRTPIDGIHIPISWQDRIPSGDDVMVHIRMAAAEEEMRCQGKIRLEESIASSHWLPRG